jgi:hypothetical protein
MRSASLAPDPDGAEPLRLSAAGPLGVDDPHRLFVMGALFTPPTAGRKGAEGPCFSGRTADGPRGGDRSRAGREGGYTISLR